MLRIVHVFGKLDRGGAETMIMNIYRNIDRKKIQFDFIVHTDEKCDYNDEILSLGGRIYSVPRFSGKNIIQYVHSWNMLLNSHPEWHILHSHIRSTAAIILVVAKHKNIRTISHSHSISSGKGFSALIKNILQYPIRFIADYCFACSLKSGEWLFGKKKCSTNNFILLPNAINVSEYAFNQKFRDEIRNSLSIHNELIIGHVGRFEYPKNHKFLIDVFNTLQQSHPNAKLVLVGEGTLKKEIEKYVETLNLKEKVMFLGLRKDVNKLMMAFDCMVFPSFFEGFPVTLVEAQATGLAIVGSSEAISDDVRITDLLTKISLTDSKETWNEVINQSIATCYSIREEYANKVIDAGFDIKKNVDFLEKFYLSI